MKHLLSLLLLLFMAHTLAFAQTGEDDLVRDAFNKYKEGILNDKGEEAVKYVDRRTIKYYNDILVLVKEADSVSVESLSIMDKLMVLVVRHKATTQDILSFNGRSMLVYAIKNGMVGKNSVANNTIGEVIIDGTFAKGLFVNNGKSTNYYFHFYKEEEAWKVDLTALFPMANVTFQTMADESGKTTNEFIFELLELMTGRKVGPEIWTPVH